MVLDSGGAATGDEDNVGPGGGFKDDFSEESCGVGEWPDSLRVAAIARDQSAEHDGICVRDLEVSRRRAGWEEFLAGDQDGDSGASDDFDMCCAQGAQETEVRGAQASAGHEGNCPFGQVFSLAAEVSAGGKGLDNIKEIASEGGGFDPGNGIRAWRDGRAGHEANGLASLDNAREGATWKGLTDDVE